MRGDGEGFFRTLGKSFSFPEYEELCDRNSAASIRHFLKLMVLATILMFIAAIPAFVNFSKNVDAVISNFDQLKITINASSKGPIILFPGDRHREVTIDWESNATDLSQGKYLVSKDRLIKRTFFGSQYTNLTGYSNVLEHREKYKAGVMILVLFLIPSMVVGAYVLFGIKFILMILGLALAAFVITRTIRFDIEFRNSLNIAIYASTIGILIEMISFPYNIYLPYFRIEWVGYALSLVYFIVGLRYAGYFEERRNRRREMSQRRRYLPLREE